MKTTGLNKRPMQQPSGKSDGRAAPNGAVLQRVVAVVQC